MQIHAVARILPFFVLYSLAGGLATPNAETNLQSRSFQIEGGSLSPGGVRQSSAQFAMWAGIGYPAAGRSESPGFVVWAGTGVLHWGASDIIPALQPESVLEFAVLPAAPNPFNADTAIRYCLPAQATVTLKIYDPAGRLVREIDPGTLDAGWHALEWNGRDACDLEVPPGLYFYTFQAGSQTSLGRMVLLK